MKEKKQTRRYFLKSAMIGLVVGIAVLWDKMILTQNRINANSTVTLPFSMNSTISFQDDFIIVNQDGKTKVFSSRCTHLGCKINQHSDSQLLCPCHGSTFNLEGKATKGPAVKSLEKLDFTIDLLTNEITVVT